MKTTSRRPSGPKTHRTPSQMTNRALLMAIAAVIALATVVSTEAQADTLSFRLGGSDAAVTDDSYDFLSDDPFLSMGQLGVHYALLDNLWVGMEYAWGVENLDPLQGVSTTLDIDGLYLSARGQYEVLSFLTPYAVLGGGFNNMELDVTVAGQSRAQTATTFLAYGLIGTEIHLPKSSLRKLFKISKRGWARDLTIGFALEAGYQWSGQADFTELSRPSSDDEPEQAPLEASDLNLGTVDLSGVVMRSAFFVRF